MKTFKMLNEEKVKCIKCDWTGEMSQVHTDRGGHNFLCPKCKGAIKTLKEEETIDEAVSLDVQIKRLEDKIESTRNLYPTPARKLKLKKMRAELETLQSKR